jgi:hypothetical protein
LSDIEIHRPASVEPFVVEGEIVEMREHGLCGDTHTVMSGDMLCCCGEAHAVDGFICCQCGHHHDLGRRCLPAGPCGSYLCCIG